LAETFGSVLRDKRRQASLSQRELASQAGLDFSYISKLENDRLPPPSADTIVLLSSILQCPSEELLALTGKLPQEVQEAVGTSKAAQEFLQNASLMKLTESEWRSMMSLLRRLREDES
jgi:HTH-type transcriptional regulator, competence development regulator